MKIPPDAIFGRNWTYSEETFEGLQNRYSGFGVDIYLCIQNEFPELFRNLRFYQSDVLQRNDSYAICEIDPPFGIQLDPDCEAVVIASKSIHIEIGRWSSNPCEEAVDFIREHFNKELKKVTENENGA